MYVDDYRKLTIQTRKHIYRAYAGIFENLSLNQLIRNHLTGIIFENENNVFTFKLYNPANFQDPRLLYQPTEINRIGKNKKTSIPVKVYGVVSSTNFNLIDSQEYDIDVFSSDSDDQYEKIVFDSNA